MPKTIVITGASSGFGAMTARALADAGDTVYAGIRDTAGRNAPAVADVSAYAAAHSVNLRAVEMDVGDQASVDAAVKQVISDTGRLDVVIHNAGHMVLGPAEAFTVEQVAEIYDTNVLSTQRVNRAALPHLRAQRDGLLVWVGSSSSRGGTPPYLAPYFAAKAAEDALAVSYAAERPGSASTPRSSCPAHSPPGPTTTRTPRTQTTPQSSKTTTRSTRASWTRSRP